MGIGNLVGNVHRAVETFWDKPREKWKPEGPILFDTVSSDAFVGCV
jgi:hypothetical protein